MAEAVMFAMIWSFILSRTLVPTMAKYLLQPHVASCTAATAPPSRNPLVRFQRGFEARFERVRAGYRDLLSMALRAPRRCSSSAFMAFVVGVVPAGAVPRPQLLSLGRCRPDPDACRAPRSAPASRKRANQFADMQKAIRQIIPPGEIETLADNIGMPISGINMTYNNTGVIGPQDGDIQIKLKEGHRPTADYVRALREQLPRAVSRHDLLVPAGRHRQPDPEFRRAGADRPADPRRRTSRRTSPTPTSC